MVGWMFSDEAFAKNIHSLLADWSYQRWNDENKNVKMSVILESDDGKDGYIFFCYPSIERETAKKFNTKQIHRLQSVVGRGGEGPTPYSFHQRSWWLQEQSLFSSHKVVSRAEIVGSNESSRNLIRRSAISGNQPRSHRRSRWSFTQFYQRDLSLFSSRILFNYTGHLTQSDTLSAIQTGSHGQCDFRNGAIMLKMLTERYRAPILMSILSLLWIENSKFLSSTVFLILSSTNLINLVTM